MSVPANAGAEKVALDADFLQEATLVVTDVQSMPLAQSILAAYPGASAVLELDRDRFARPLP